MRGSLCLLAAAWLVVGLFARPAGAGEWAARPGSSPATGDDSGTSAPGPIAIRVGGREVDLWSYERGLEAYLRETNAPATDTAARRAYRDRLIDELLVESHAARTGVDRDREYLRLLAEARRRLLYRLVLEREVLSRIEITTESVRAWYDSHKDAFTEPQRIQVRHILTRASSSTEQARRRIVGGEDFAAVAAEVSIHASKLQGGLLPPFARGAYQPEFEDAAFALKVGELSPVIKTDLGFHVIEKTAEKPARLKPLAEVEDEIRRLLYDAEAERRTVQFLERLRRREKIGRRE